MPSEAAALDETRREMPQQPAPLKASKNKDRLLPHLKPIEADTVHETVHGQFSPSVAARHRAGTSLGTCFIPGAGFCQPHVRGTIVNTGCQPLTDTFAEKSCCKRKREPDGIEGLSQFKSSYSQFKSIYSQCIVNLSYSMIDSSRCRECETKVTAPGIFRIRGLNMDSIIGLL